MVTQWLLGFLLIASSLGIITVKKPVHAALSFLLTLLSLAFLYLQLNAEFIAVMQVLVYAGAILVIFMFVIVLFQDAHQQLDKFFPQCFKPLLIVAGITFPLTLIFIGSKMGEMSVKTHALPEGFGTVQSLGKVLYVDFFFPFEAITVIFLIAIIGALYVGRKEA